MCWESPPPDTTVKGLMSSREESCSLIWLEFLSLSPV